MHKFIAPTVTAVAFATLAMACSSPASPAASTTTTTTSTTTTPTSPTTSTAPSWYSRFQTAQVTVSVEGNFVVLKSNTVPDHKSPYWGVGNSMYEAPHSGMMVNPNLIVSQALTIKVPISPAIASSTSDTPLGPMGMAVNGVPLFNQYAAGRSPLTSEIISFDKYDGHPQQSGQYHYHMDPYWLTGNNGSSSASSLIGVLTDGFPVYGTKETSGSAPTGLDSCNGHTHATADVPAGIYHYHVTATVPYISGCFKGTPGSVG